jgi:hypothetical protein
VDGDRGSATWTRNAGGVTGVGADEEVVAGVDASDRLNAWKTRDGAPAWTVENLLYRHLSAPIVVGNAVVTGDLQGMVHWFARDTGGAVLRLPTDGSPIKVSPVASGLTLLVVTSDGGLHAFRPQ